MTGKTVEYGAPEFFHVDDSMGVGNEIRGSALNIFALPRALAPGVGLSNFARRVIHTHWEPWFLEANGDL
jgi:hypothetical protein